MARRLAALSAMLGGGAGIVAAPAATTAHAATGPSVTFTAAIPAELAGGAWELSTSTLYPAQSIMLASGQLGDHVTTVSTEIAATAALIDGGSNEFSLHVVRPIDDSHAWAGGTVEGLTPSEIAAGGQVTMTLHLDQVPLIPTSAAQQSSTASARSVSTPISSTTSAISAAAPAHGTLFQAPTKSALPHPRSGPTYLAPSTSATSLAPSPSCTTATCGQTSTSVTSFGCNGLSNSSHDCILDSQDIHGVQTFRGYSAHVAGEDQTFDVQQSNTDKMDNGYRVQAGPFSGSGNTSISNGSGSDTTWPVRGYCWAGVNDDPNGCALDGSLATFGNDSWRWEKHLFQLCSGLAGCQASTYEVLYDNTYDGGTIVGTEDTTGYYALPSQIKANQKGSWAPYLPGARVSLWLQRTSAYGDASAVNVSYPDAYSSATFNSSETYQTYQKVVNSHNFMTINFLGDFYRYDNGQSPWQAEFWSCDWAPGWTGGAPCYQNGA